RYELSEQDGIPHVDGDPLIFFHAHGFQPASPGVSRKSNLSAYGVAETATLVSLLDRYESALEDAIREIALPLAMTMTASTTFRDTVALAEWAKSRIAALETQLASAETDRAVSLETIAVIRDELRVSEGHRAASLEAVASLRDRLSDLEAQLLA